MNLTYHYANMADNDSRKLVVEAKVTVVSSLLIRVHSVDSVAVVNGFAIELDICFCIAHGACNKCYKSYNS